MTQMRLIQNFQGLRAVVISPAIPDALQIGLTRLGLAVEHVPEHNLAAAEGPLLPERDIVIIDGDPGVPSTLIALLIEQKLPVPIIGLVGTEAPSRLRMLMEAGATAFLRKPVYGGAVYSSLFLGVNVFRRRQQDENRLAENERRRRGRRHVIKAILQMMRQETVDDDTAYEMLRCAAMRTRLNIEDFCETWLLDAKAGTPMTAPVIHLQEKDHA